MLKQLIESLRAGTTRYNTSLWYYRISGDILEFMVLPSYQNHKKQYRLAVISVGQAILALSKKLEQQGFTSLIQSFPSIARPDLVASIRYSDHQKKNLSQIQQLHSPEVLHHSALFSTLKTEAERFQLGFLPVQNRSFFAGHLPGNLKNTELYLLVSSFDNPFYWIKTGYWKENISPFLAPGAIHGSLLNIDLEKPYNEQKQTTGPAQNKYIQGTISLLKSRDASLLNAQ